MRVVSQLIFSESLLTRVVRVVERCLTLIEQNDTKKGQEQNKMLKITYLHSHLYEASLCKVKKCLYIFGVSSYFVLVYIFTLL